MRPLLAFGSALLIVLLGPPPAWAQIFDWTGGGATDAYDDPANWNGIGIPDNPGESARFNLGGLYDVTLDSGVTKLDDLILLSGVVGFTSADVGVTKHYVISDDLIATGPASFSVGTYAGGGASQNVPVLIEVGDELRIDGGASVNILGDAGIVSQIRAGDLRLADQGSGSGSLSVVGPGALFEQTGAGIVNLGQDGPAQLTLSDGATAEFNAVLQLANFADPGSTASVLVESGSQLTAGLIQVAPGGPTSSGVSADFLVTGKDSEALLSGSLIVGAGSVTTATYRVFDQARSEVAGLATVRATGTLTVAGGQMDALGGLTVDAGGSVMVEDDGHLQVVGDFDASAAGGITHFDGVIEIIGGEFKPIVDPVNDSYLIRGIGGSDLPEVVLGAGSSFAARNLFLGGTVLFTATDGAIRVEGGADVTLESGFYAGSVDNSVGSAVITGAGSTLDALTVVVGDDGDGTVEVADGGRIDAGSLPIGDRSDSTGTLTIRDAASRIVVGGAGNRRVEVGVRGTGTLEALGGVIEAESLYVASETVIPGIDVGDGTVMIDGGQIDLSSALVAGLGGPAQINVENGELNVGNQAFLHPKATVTIDGGTLSVGRLEGHGGRLVLNSGELLVADPTQPLLVGPQDLSIGGQTIEQDNTSPNLLLGDERISVAGDLIVLPGGYLRQFGGELSAGGLTIATGGEFRRSSGVLSVGRVATAIGSTLNLSAGSPVTLGDAGAFNGVVIAGTLLVGNNAVITLLDANDAVFDSGALVDFSGGPISEMIAANGLTIDFGATFTGEAILTTPDDPTKPVINNGHLIGESLAEPITLTGYAKGVGTCDNCLITGTDAPGFSPATVIRGSVAYRGALEIEIGGTGSGDFDRLEHRLGVGVADLGGELQIASIDGYQFASGDAFEFLTADGGIAGVFATESLPALGGGLGLDVLYGVDSVTLAVVGVEGDYNYDGLVDAADYTVWRDTLGQTGAGLAADGDNNGVVEAADHAVWQANYGATAAALATAVPEPATGVLVLMGGIGLLRRRLKALLDNLS